MKRYLKYGGFLLIACFTLVLSSLADVPMTITFQGLLNDDTGTPVDGIQTTTFSFFDVATEGVALWSETQDVTYVDGLFTVELGTITPLDLDFSQQYWLGITVGAEELLPRISTSSSAFSIRARYVQQLSEDNVRQFWMLVQTMPDADGDGYDKVSQGGDDCDDLSPYIHPGATELCDNVDNDCNGQIDDGAESACLPLPPNVDQAGCDRGECVIIQCSEDYIDENGIYQDGCETECILVYIDIDADMYVTGTAPEPFCADPAGGPYVLADDALFGDCNDENAMIHPGAEELCDGLDNDCNDLIDDSPDCQDYDGDGVPDYLDNCPQIPNDQTDTDDDGDGDACDDDDDGDGYPDVSDNCPLIYNLGQLDRDSDGIGDACDDDMDGDGVPNDVDICPENYDPGQEDMDDDGIGDACDDDKDGDGIINRNDICPDIYNPGQEDMDDDGIGDVCDDDADGDGVTDTEDNCPGLWNPGQEDIDDDGIGDQCDDDRDGDDIPNSYDICPTIYNPGQEDMDDDGIGDVCDDDIDGDGVLNGSDNCPYVYNPGQEDADENGIGDACDF